MVQQVVVLLVLGGCALWLGRQVYRFFKPIPNGRACGGNCCSGDETPKQGGVTPPKERLVMISSDDLRARLKARRG